MNLERLLHPSRADAFTIGVIVGIVLMAASSVMTLADSREERENGHGRD